MGCEAPGAAQAANLRGIGAEGRDQLAEIRLVEHARRFGRRNPFALALALFLPLVGDLVDLERIDQHLARHFLAGRKRLGIEIAAGFLPRNGAGQAGFLAGFARRGVAEVLAAFRPALGQNPAAGVAAGDEHASRRRRPSCARARRRPAGGRAPCRTAGAPFPPDGCSSVHSSRQEGNAQAPDSFAALLIVRLIIENKSKNSIWDFKIPASRKRRNRRDSGMA